MNWRENITKNVKRSCPIQVTQGTGRVLFTVWDTSPSTKKNSNGPKSQFRKSLNMFRQLGNRRGMAECMAGLAGLKARQGDAEWGAVMLSAAETVLKVTGGAWWPADRVEVESKSGNHPLGVG